MKKQLFFTLLFILACMNTSAQAMASRLSLLTPSHRTALAGAFKRAYSAYTQPTIPLWQAFDTFNQALEIGKTQEFIRQMRHEPLKNTLPMRYQGNTLDIGKAQQIGSFLYRNKMAISGSDLLKELNWPTNQQVTFQEANDLLQLALAQAMLKKQTQ